MEPMLNSIDAMAEQGCYNARFQLANGAEQSVILRVRDGEVAAPEANMIAGWSPRSDSFRAVIAVVRAMDDARRLVGAQRPQLLDIDGGWDVGLGNVLLDDDGLPACVAHGRLQQGAGDRWACEECGAAARFQQPT